MRLPAPDAPADVLNKFALAFDGYKWGGGGPEQLAARIECVASERPDGCIILDHETDTELIRALMFWEQRGTRWAEEYGDWGALEQFLRTGVERLHTLQRRPRMKYLHKDAPGVYHLDHRLAPEVVGMLCAMSSRMPLGGIQARYMEIIEAVAEGLWEDAQAEALKGNGYENKKRLPSWEDAKAGPMWNTDSTLRQAEDRLCEYPIHPRIQKFFDQFVLRYGHSSILELC